MNKRVKIIKNYLGELMVVVGAGIFSYNIFSFSHPDIKTGFGAISAKYGIPPDRVAYYYLNDTLLLITIGAILIVVGILIIKNKASSVK